MDTEELAKGYTAVNDTQYNAGLFLLEKLEIVPGLRVLDVGCGPGNLTSHIATCVGDHGSVVGIDPSQERIAIARARGRTTPNLSFHEGKAEDLSLFAAASFDVVYVNSTFHWVEDQPAALQEFARVLKQGGRLGISGGSGDFVSAQEKIKAEVLSREPYRRYPEKSGPKFLKQRELGVLLDGAGLARRQSVTNKIVKLARNGEAMIEWLDTSSSGKTYGSIPLDLRPKAREEMKQEWNKIATKDGIQMDMELLVTVAIKE
ncbi:S-adenosyl-L-methionine-dependent methyltransferase [Truncatella angustata]|uniref:S-adenosyl-L-methionine-dependent methyltransferase n=1 Tax=Truncatella angustata TaxID=152316 RepID=A0A9P8RFF9_9PEZI|nr:S-adenosyl-L-methionine-dependent methyltransferase [Truncatella angustata]KAH6643448.1 S-adenosyl-L-methionine-dependent methyltransferase [Truncatella angustata]